ncbi:hypothetical protein OTU49_015598 [Cherax quadricarinatus]|uniref:Uncharacterized protein n=2 Tax=Cherax quadricarinatus TaxID=27406 RepID=A0AAW0YDH3_CHEQU
MGVDVWVCVVIILGSVLFTVAVLAVFVLSATTTFTIIIIVVICVSTRHVLKQRRWWSDSNLQVNTQSEDAESGGDAGETSVTTDAPPKYDTVVGKPPPYSHLYTSAEACYLPVYHTPQHTDGDTTLTSEEEETTRDTDPPPYSEVSKTIAPV